MSEWKEFKLSDLMDVIGGGTPKTSNPKYWNGGIPWLSVVDFGNGIKKVYKTEKSITEEGLKNSSTKILKKGQIIISARGTVGELAVLGSDMAFNQSCYGLNAKTQICSNEFLYYLLKIKVPELRRNAHGAVFDTITRSSFDTIAIRLPPLSTQTAIAEILSSLDDKIELNNAINKNLEELAQAIFKRWFVDFEFPDENGQPYKSSGGEMVDSELGMIPKGWRVLKLSDIIIIIGGGTPKRSIAKYWGGIIKWFSVQDIPKNSEVFVINTSETITEDGLINSSTKLLSVGTTIITARGTVGKLALVAEPMAMNQSCYGVIGNEGIGKYFNYFNLQHLVQRLQKITHGAVFDTITTATFESIIIPIGRKRTIQRFDKLIEPIMNNIEKNVRESESLKNLRDTLLPKLISGELEVKEAQTQIENTL